MEEITIYNKEPILALYDMVKGLLFDSEDNKLEDGIPIFKEIMDEEGNDIPESYILLRSQLADSTSKWGDGHSMVRRASCDIILVTKGYANDTTDLHNVNKVKIRNHLKAQGKDFQERNLGFVESSQSTEHTFTLGVYYFG